MKSNSDRIVKNSDMDEKVEKAKAEGATVMNGPFDVATHGRMAVIKDPTGAVFAVWQPLDHQGSGVWGVPGAATWSELGTNDTDKAGEFYANVFGWTKEPFGDMYTVLKNDNKGIGGMYKLTPEMGPMPPNWLLYFSVEDADAAVQKATELGAQVMRPAEEIPGVGRFAILTDPQGAAFAVIKTQPHG